jgi:hypothetical protein
MRLLVGFVLLSLIVGIAASVQSVNSTNKSIISSVIARNVTNQTNNPINQTNITNRMNSSNQTNISVVARSVLSNGINRSAMATPSKAAFESEPVSSAGGAAVRVGEGPVMGTPSQASFDSYVI